MERQIFRQKAIDEMASPDRLDQPLHLVRPADWIFIAVIAATIVFACVWGLITRVPIEVPARGILISSGGLSEISVQYPGRLEEMLVQSGDQVEQNQVIARFSRLSRTREITAGEAALADARAQANAAEETYRAAETAQSDAETRLSESLKRRSAELRRLLETRDQTVENMRSLVEQDAATQEELASVIASRDELRAELRNIDQDILQIDVTAARRRGERGEARLSESQLVQQRARELAQLQAQTQDEAVLRAPTAGEVLEVLSNVGDVVAPGQALAVIDGQSVSDGGGRYEAILYSRPATGKRIAPGMAVKIVPTTAEEAIYGHIDGEVVSTATFPASREAMVRTLQNQRLVDELSAEGAPIEVRVRLQRAPQTPSGFAWSSSQGPEWAITQGTMLEAKVVLEKRPFLAVVFPGLVADLSE